ncbi:CHASE2 domain-containing serine/threonine-protein kinase [Beggiatoa leptomitoformis]|uniref:non-specific serine/threonine protein kinase n=1 Tax=Beggiatoa leptomitoformis TaxID=288004 RepID=A0A2N9YDF9_9GAMM|nr:serine/threonine-protein kinase [Beggiatoa leptomitoformis]ALG69179.1 protein kinase [Beggiatoa leptomitoformis]AUI68395.1 protein kinase [Beggiatoa leptomitoformis]
MTTLKEKLGMYDWIVGILVAVCLLGLAQFGLLQPLENSLYALGLRHTNHNAGEKVAVIAIDQASMAQLGDWQWSRTVYAQLLGILQPYADVVATDIDFSKPQQDAGTERLAELMTFYTKSPAISQLSEELGQLSALIATATKARRTRAAERDSLAELNQFHLSSPLWTELPNTLTTLEDKLNAAYSELDADGIFADNLKKSGKWVFGVPIMRNEPPIPLENIPEGIMRNRLTTVSERFDTSRPSPQPLSILQLQMPLPIFSNNASVLPDILPTNTAVPLVVQYQHLYLPNLPLFLAAQHLRVGLQELEVRLGQGVRLGALRINTDTQLQIQPFFYHDIDDKSALTIDSFVDVLQGKISPEKYRDKIVLIGVTAPYHSVTQSTPVGELPHVVVLAHTVSSLLNQDFLITPEWALSLQTGVFLLVIAYLCFLLPDLKWRIALFISGLSFICLVVLYFSLLRLGWSISLILPLLLLPLGHILMFVKRSLMAYQDVFRMLPNAVESNRLLGLAFQGQGQLDMAFEKFRLCPADEGMLGLLYNLALDYERKRQSRHAAAVYRYILSHSPNFRDSERRLERLRSLRKPRLRGTTSVLDDWLHDESGEKPQLGRYQVERQLGKGAMGVVYLGKDPKLNRLVAIKTLPLSQEFEAEDLPEATTRFFREATAAGRLKHEHIVAIYDAGEEYNLAYISMEFFKGGNLTPYTKSDNLLPIATAIEIGYQAALALDYAHTQGVIHRDIKPANIMYNPGTGKIKITDFGIARITDAKRTKTGIILGTPSYMSPEQLVGKLVDGRSDLFSLGILLYQLFTGVLPFQADSMATLMYKITTEPHPDLSMLRPDMPSCLKDLINKALAKIPDHRFQTGAEFATALRDCKVASCT